MASVSVPTIQVVPAAEEASATPGSAPVQADSATPGSLNESSMVEDEPSKLLEEERFESDEDQALRLLGEGWVVKDECKWTIFEDMEDELQYHRRRSRALGVFVRAYAALHTEYDRLQEGGLGLQEAYEDLQTELKEAVGDVAYWRELAEARAEAQGADAGKAANVEVQTATAPPETLEEAEAAINGSSIPAVEPNTREALRADMLQDAKDQAARWRKVAEKRAEELSVLRRRLEGSTPAALTPRGETPSERPSQPWRETIKQSNPISRLSAGYAAQRACSPLPCFSPQRTPRQAGESEACAVLALASGGPVAGATTNASVALPAATNRRLSFLGSPSTGGKATVSSMAGPLQSIPTPSRAWGPGSLPKRCPGLGSPRRKGEQAAAGVAASLQQRSNGSSSPTPYARVNARPSLEPRTRTSLIGRQLQSTVGKDASSETALSTELAARRQSISLAAVGLGKATRRSSTALMAACERSAKEESFSKEASAHQSDVARGARTPPPMHGRIRTTSPKPPHAGTDEELSIPKHITDLTNMWQDKK